MDQALPVNMLNKFPVKLEKNITDCCTIHLHRKVSKIIHSNAIPLNYLHFLNWSDNGVLGHNVYMNRTIFNLFLEGKLLSLMSLIQKTSCIHQCSISTNCKSKCVCFNNVNLFNLYRSFYNLLRAYNHCETVTDDLVKRLKQSNLDWNAKTSTENRICTNCSVLKQNFSALEKENKNLFAVSETSRAEKEKMVVKYAASEKRLFETQRYVHFIINFLKEH